jgi:hypothetical protein
MLQVIQLKIPHMKSLCIIDDPDWNEQMAIPSVPFKTNKKLNR